MDQGECHELAMELVIKWEKDLAAASNADPKDAFSVFMLTACGLMAKLYMADGRDPEALAAMAAGCEMLAATVRDGELLE